MHESNNISNILNAVNEINNRPIKRKDRIESFKNQKLILSEDLPLAPDVDKIITEAENYKKKSPLNVDPLIIKEKSSNNKPDNNKTFEEIKNNKNTLKIILNLNLKIKDLEKKLENFQVQKEQTLNENKLILKDEFVESSKTSSPSTILPNEIISKNKNYLKNEVVTSLKIQDASINLLNKKIQNFKNTEERLLTQIIDLEQDKTILLKKAEKFEVGNDYKTILNDTKESLKTIYNQVEKQKSFFLSLKNHSIKTERDFNFYKKNYEKLIIENNDVKKKLLNTMQKVESFEEIKKELAYIFENFNNVLSKNSIVKLNESFSKITSSSVVSDSISKKNK